MSRLGWIPRLAVCLFVLATAASAADGAHELGKDLPLWTLVPFMGTLLAIALFPLFAPHFWEKNKNKAVVAALFAIPTAIYLIVVHGAAGRTELWHKVEEYISFVILLASLFIISGGIYVRGSLRATPALNTGIMALGAVIANLIGTTGASVLLIRPILRANAHRAKRVHVVIFFLFTVSNCGGLLTPLGDPPLFLGYLKGVPFEWTLRLWKEWALVNAIVLAIFCAWDRWAVRRETGSPQAPPSSLEPVGIEGSRCFLFLLGIVAAIYASGRGLLNGGKPWPFGVQEGCMAVIAVVAWFLTPGANRAKNRFTFGPIVEVAVLFAGIFVTMGPALLILNAWGQGHRADLGEFGLRSAAGFYWGTGVLSSFLDNAPTYLTFASTACGLNGIELEGRYLNNLLHTANGPTLLTAISCGAVMMGANTYIGNGPNFMVKAIADENGVKMPSFFGYMIYSTCILLPVFGIVTLIFFSA